MIDVLAFTGGPYVGHTFSAVILIRLCFCLCLAFAGGMMLFCPDRAFRTERKPRWLGLPLFFLGVVGVFNCLILASS